MHLSDVVENDTRSSYLEGVDRDEDEMEVAKAESDSPSEKSKHDGLTTKMGFSFGTGNGDITDDDPCRQAEPTDKGHGHLQLSEKVENTGPASDLSLEAPGNTTGIVPVLFQGLPPTNGENAGAESRTSVSLLPTNVTAADPIIRTIGTLPRNINLSSLNKNSITSGTLQNRGKVMQHLYRKRLRFFCDLFLGQLSLVLTEKYLEEYFKQYVDLIAQKYGFWNRTGGTEQEEQIIFLWPS
ncbi:hypothetical protein Tsubulata_007212 [Turnera subulata]|uniref:Uncharacterized protein n=1 Tax=Turnera subulata TaxID=218843 RepID=A0A9Q0F4U0_9ROSI|nr:hypothetical protein Tsubulata_007212 [Turnera subulata]